jgi:NADP-dependent 3-hydroxy acid dehydrogenase YdfG
MLGLCRNTLELYKIEQPNQKQRFFARILDIIKSQTKNIIHQENKVKMYPTLFLKLFFAFLLITANGFSEQKVVLISGATSGIGLATTKAFAENGWKVWAGYRQYIPEELKQMKNVTLCHLDVTDDRLVQAAIEAILKKDRRIDILINNAGYGLIGPEECVTVDEAQQLFDVNFFGPLRLIQAVLPTMRQQQSGHILNISSGVGIYSLPGLGLYSASKFALEGMSESLAATLSHWKIKVSLIEPGFVKNDWGKHCIVGSRAINEDFYQKLTQGICQMLSTPQGQPCEEVAALLVKIAETSEPDVRYQTNAGMKDWIGKKLVDPSGMTEYRDNLQFINSRIRDSK